MAVFDIDGTLTRTTDVDDTCFVRALREIFALADFDTDWANYPHATDEGLLHEIVTRRRGHAPTPDERAAMRARFFDLLAARRDDGASYQPAPGAAAFVAALRRAGWAVALATGAWRASARIKLEAAGLGAWLGDGPESLPLATADDHVSRAGIVRRAIARALARAAAPGTNADADANAARGVSAIALSPDAALDEPAACAALRARAEAELGPIIAFGDGVWDARTARALELVFVGVSLAPTTTTSHAAGAAAPGPASARARRLREHRAVAVLDGYLHPHGPEALADELLALARAAHAGRAGPDA